MNIIRESHGVAVVEIDGRFYVVGIDRERGQVTSVLASDMPDGGGQWFAGISESGVRYVGHGTSRSAALAQYRRLVRAAREEKSALVAGAYVDIDDEPSLA